MEICICICNIPIFFYLIILGQVKELQRQTGVRIKVVSTSEDTDSNEAIIVIEESFASGQVSAQVTILGVIAVMNPS